jgi:hypothetical protein
MPSRSAPQRSEILSTIGKPQPPLKSGRGPGLEGTSKPEPGSSTFPRTEPPLAVTTTRILSLGESPAWRMLLVTSSFTTNRRSSSFVGGKKPASRFRAWRAVEGAPGSGVSFRSIFSCCCVIVKGVGRNGRERRHVVSSSNLHRVTTSDLDLQIVSTCRRSNT